MILEPGTKVFVAHRRLFETDQSRYFLGQVDDYEDGIARVSGHTWTRDGYSGEFHRKKDARTKIISLASGSVMVYQLPSSMDLGSAVVRSTGKKVYLQDSDGFEMDLSEGVLTGGESRTTSPGRRTG